jgi:hypothetical protein
MRRPNQLSDTLGNGATAQSASQYLELRERKRGAGADITNRAISPVVAPAANPLYRARGKPMMQALDVQIENPV